jgi:tRNA threonylcarbamoyl adenosine modification protein (Sua5/YciO/YrdC/YwlC family)
LPRDVGVVVVAGGKGIRLGGEPKQFRPVAGVPMLERALRPFLGHPEVAAVVAVVPAETLAAPPDWLGRLLALRLHLTTGGAERADSVRHGLAVLPESCTTVLVHDAARPFPSRDVIDAVIASARRGRAAIAAIPVTDTLKVAAVHEGDSPAVESTFPREGLWRAQTPQGFPREVLEQAHAVATRGATDDAQLVELLGHAVELVPDSALNIKVTTEDDLRLAEAIAALDPPELRHPRILPFRTVTDLNAAVPVVKEHLGKGLVLAYPTETVYGLGSAPTMEGLERLAVLKGRSREKPFLLLISERTMAEQWGLTFTASAKALAEAFWPGPLTLVLPGGEGRLPEMLRGAEGGVAVRHTSHPLVSLLVARLGEPLTSTSANRPGQPPAPGPERIADVFAPELDRGDLLILDGGALGNVPPSTVVDCTGPLPKLIREGALPRAELRRAVGRLAP